MKIEGWEWRNEILTAEVEDGVAGLDVGKEGVSQSLSLRRTLHQPGDVHHVEEGGHLAADKV